MTETTTITYRPGPIPANASPIARRLIAIANLVPAGRWVTYGDLAEAAGSSPRGVASALSSVSPWEDDPEDNADSVGRWVVPWHRIRMEDGRLKSREAQLRALGQTPREHHRLANAMYAAERGSLFIYQGEEAARGSQRFLLAAEMRHGRVKVDDA